MERQLKSWATVEADAVEGVLAENEAAEHSMMITEDMRRDMLKGQTTQQFKVFRQSTNANAFGHHQFWLLAKDGTCDAVMPYPVQQCMAYR